MGMDDCHHLPTTSIDFFGTEQLTDWHRQNARLRSVIHKEVKKPGLNYDRSGQ